MCVSVCFCVCVFECVLVLATVHTFLGSEDIFFYIFHVDIWGLRPGWGENWVRVMVRVRVRHLFRMVRVRIRCWRKSYIYVSPHKGKSTNMRV